MSDAELAEMIMEIHDRSRRTYGAPRVHAELARVGRRCGRKRVARLMRSQQLVGVHARRRLDEWQRLAEMGYLGLTLPAAAGDAADPIPLRLRTWSNAISTRRVPTGCGLRT